MNDCEEQPTKKREKNWNLKLKKRKRKRESENKLHAIAIKQLIKLVKKKKGTGLLIDFSMCIIIAFFFSIKTSKSFNKTKFTGWEKMKSAGKPANTVA